MNPAIAHNIDLHSHTAYSDGRLSVEALLEHAAAHGVSTLAITDHDSVGAHIEINQRKISHPSITVIPGLEVSCQYGNREIHVVGLNVDIHDPQLTAFVTQQQTKRRERLQLYANKLESLGLEGIVNAVSALTSESVTRAHLAQILVSKGYVPDNARAFKRYLGRKGRAHVKAEWPSLSETVATITTAGGVAVIAHPGRYQLSRKQLLALMTEFAEAGGHGIELSYPNADKALIRWLTEKALSLGLYASQGADFHNPEWQWVKPGHFPALPKSVEPIWSLWQA